MTKAEVQHGEHIGSLTGSFSPRSEMPISWHFVLQSNSTTSHGFWTPLRRPVGSSMEQRFLVRQIDEQLQSHLLPAGIVEAFDRIALLACDC